MVIANLYGENAQPIGFDQSQALLGNQSHPKLGVVLSYLPK